MKIAIVTGVTMEESALSRLLKVATSVLSTHFLVSLELMNTDSLRLLIE